METQEISILQEKVESMINRNRIKCLDVISQIEEDNTNLRDYVLPLGRSNKIDFSSNGTVKMALLNENEVPEQIFDIHQNALNQLGLKFGIPTKYLNDLNKTDWGRKLITDIFKEHKFHTGRSRILARVVGNEVRGVLSDKYRRLNSNEIYAQYLSGIKESGAVVYDALYTDTQTYMSAIIPQVFLIPTENNGIVYSVFGSRIQNSDFGNSSLNIRSFQMNVVCLNGMVSDTVLKEVHLGKQLPDNIDFSERTYELDTESTASAVRDIMKSIMGRDRILETVSKKKESSSQLIDTKAQIKKLPRLGMRKDEVSQVEVKLMENDPATGVQGKNSLWKLTQAITSVSNDGTSERKRELDEIAGSILKL